MKSRIWEPSLGFKDIWSVTKTMYTGEISGKTHLNKVVEKQLEKVFDLQNMSLCANGTIACELVFRTLEIGAGDIVIVPEMSYLSPINVMVALGITPLMCPIDPGTLQIDVNRLIFIIESQISKIKAVFVVHNYGLCADMKRIRDICDLHEIILIEDCAEAICSKSNGTAVGKLADAAVFSFFANKLITSGEGGAVAFRRLEDKQKADLIKNQYVIDKELLIHSGLGFNFRLSALNIALLSSQINKLAKIQNKRKKIHIRYKQQLESGKITFQIEDSHSNNLPWLFNVFFEDKQIKQNVMQALIKNGIECRSIFPSLAQHQHLVKHIRGESTNSVFDKIESGLSLPSHSKLKKKEIDAICQIVLNNIN